MAELTQKERLQPSLLDRLTDNEPDKKQESRNQRILSLKKLREGVLRDLAWLLNSSNLNGILNLDDYPLIEKSVLNYGLPELVGTTASGVDTARIEQHIKEAIVTFEPRIIGNTVKIRVTTAQDRISHNTITIEIEGELWAQPTPFHLVLKSEVDLETGSFKIADDQSMRSA